MPNYLQDAMDRIVAMQKEAITVQPEGTFVDAFPHWPYEQESYPYIINRPGAMSIDDNSYGEDITLYTRQVLMRLVVDHITAGYAGDMADLTYQYMVELETYFRQHPMLNTDTSVHGSFTDPPDFLFQECRLIADTGLIGFQNTGTGTIQLGVEFTLEIGYLREVI